MNIRGRIVEMKTDRESINKMIEHMEGASFLLPPAAGSYHLAYEGGLAEHI